MGGRLSAGHGEGGSIGRKRDTPEQVVHLLREAEVLLSQGRTVPMMFWELGFGEQTYCRWRRTYGGLDVSHARRLKRVGFGRIFFHTRQEGLSYGCGLILDVGDEHSTLRTLGSCRPEVTVQLIQAVLEEARGGETNPLSDEEIETARNFLIGDVIQRNERARDIVSQSLHDLVNDRPADHLERYFEALRRADREGVQRCGRDYNHLADSLVVLVLGDPSRFETSLESLGLGPVRELEPIRFGE